MVMLKITHGEHTTEIETPEYTFPIETTVSDVTEMLKQNCCPLLRFKWRYTMATHNKSPLWIAWCDTTTPDMSGPWGLVLTAELTRLCPGQKPGVAILPMHMAQPWVWEVGALLFAKEIGFELHRGSSIRKGTNYHKVRRLIEEGEREFTWASERSR